MLRDIGAREVPSLLRAEQDRSLEPEDLEKLRRRLPDAWFVSARDPAHVASVRQRIIEIFEAAYEEIEIVIPYDRQAVLSEMHDAGRVLEERWEEGGVIVRWRSEPEAIGRIRARLRT